MILDDYFWKHHGDEAETIDESNWIRVWTSRQFCNGQPLEVGKSIPNITAMKSIKSLCEKKGLPYDEIEKAWIEAIAGVPAAYVP